MPSKRRHWRRTARLIWLASVRRELHRARTLLTPRFAHHSSLIEQIASALAEIDQLEVRLDGGRRQHELIHYGPDQG